MGDKNMRLNLFASYSDNLWSCVEPTGTVELPRQFGTDAVLEERDFNLLSCFFELKSIFSEFQQNQSLYRFCKTDAFPKLLLISLCVRLILHGEWMTVRLASIQLISKLQDLKFKLRTLRKFRARHASSGWHSLSAPFTSSYEA